MGTQEPPAEKRLKPQLRMFDAVATGLAAILGAGIFAVIAPAAAIAGPSLLVSLVLASFVAFCNALSSAQLAVAFPFTGGTYGFGRRMLGEWWGYSAGWMFLAANTVGPGVIALAFGAYLSAAIPGLPPARGGYYCRPGDDCAERHWNPEVGEGDRRRCRLLDSHPDGCSAGRV